MGHHEARLQEMADMNTVEVVESEDIAMALLLSPSDAMLLTMTLATASRTEKDRETRLRLDTIYREVRRQTKNGVLRG